MSSKPDLSLLDQEDWTEEAPSKLLEKLNESKADDDKAAMFGMMVGDRHIDEVLADCVGNDANKIQVAADALRDVLRRDPNFVFAHMSRILKTMITAFNNPKGAPLPDNPRVKSNVWGTMQLATIVKDGSLVLPSVGETYFFTVWQLLGDISKTDIGAHDVPIALVTSSLLTLWTPQVCVVSLCMFVRVWCVCVSLTHSCSRRFTPQLSSRIALYETAIPVCMQLLLCKNDSVRVSSTNILQTMGRVRPELLRSHLTTMSSRICDGFVASLPAMVELYKIQPMSKDLFAEHLDWLVELFEKHSDQRVLLATTFAAMARKQPTVFDAYAARLWPWIRDKACGGQMADMMSAVAAVRPAMYLPLLSDVKSSLACTPEHVSQLTSLMRVIASSSPPEAATTASDLIALIEAPPPAHFTTSSSDRELTWKKSIIAEIAQLVSVCPSAATLLSHRIRPFLLSSDAAIRQLSHKIYRAATFGSRDLALLADDEAFDVPEGAQQTVFATFYVKNHRPWLQYFEASRSDRGIQMPLVLMIVRWDGMLGFAGGVLEPEEAADVKEGGAAVKAAAEKALRRELREEVGVTEAGELEHICTHLTAANGSRSHFWAREVDEEKFIEIESGVRRGMHFGQEVMGAFRAPLFPTQLESFFRSNFPPGALAQLLIFLSKKNLIPARDLEAAVQV